MSACGARHTTIPAFLRCPLFWVGVGYSYPYVQHALHELIPAGIALQVRPHSLYFWWFHSASSLSFGGMARISLGSEGLWLLALAGRNLDYRRARASCSF
jgi:hypothetical protein